MYYSAGGPSNKCNLYTDQPINQSINQPIIIFKNGLELVIILSHLLSYAMEFIQELKMIQLLRYVAEFTFRVTLDAGPKPYNSTSFLMKTIK